MKEMARVPRKRMEEKSLKSIKNYPQKNYLTRSFCQGVHETPQELFFFTLKITITEN